MAARWGAGEDTLTACNMDFFQLDTLDETPTTSSEETLEALQNLDPSILSIFEDTPSIETKGRDEESEATLLTALTEILDNVDDENLSPFDTLPDSDLLSSQKTREHSPFRRLLCLSRSPPEKETLCNGQPSSIGKSLPRLKTDTLQRSDGEDEEDGSLTLSPIGQNLLPDNDSPDWDGLAIPFPVNFKQEGQDAVSVSLGDLVRHMHPYCMTISVENEQGEHILPEGGILLEVVDQGENGEPILVIPDVDLSVSLPCKEQSENEQNVSGDAGASNTSEHLNVDDDVICSEAPAKCMALSTANLDMKGEMETTRQNKGIKEKSPFRRKKKTRKLEAQPEKPEKIMEVAKLPPDSALPLPEEPQKQNPSPSEPYTETLEPEIHEQVQTSASLKPQEMPSNSPSDTVACSQQSSESSGDPVYKEEAGSSPLLLSSDTPPSPSQPILPDVSNGPPPVVPLLPEPKPKSLSLAEYRRLRQQKKPTPVEKIDADNSSKWPSLPVLPKELPPIPCLPNLSTRDPRRTNPHTGKREVEEIKSAWQPRGPCAPPTPEALLVPPAYMVSSTSKVPAATSQQTSELSKSPSPKTAPQVTPKSVKNGTVLHHTTMVLSRPPGSSDPSTSEKPNKSPSGGEAHSAHLEASKGCNQRPAELKTCPKTTAEKVQSTSAPITSEKNTAQEAIAHPVADGAMSSQSKSSKVYNTRVASAARASDSLTQKERAVSENKDQPCKVSKAEKPKTPTQELIQAFTSEIGIEASDLTSLLEQFEETQAKEEQCVLGVSGRAAAVGNSGLEPAPEKTVVERVRANDLSNTAALTPPATPPHQMWKPLVPVALKNSVALPFPSKSSKAIQIEPRPLPSFRSRGRPTSVATPSVTPEVACMDHDYCLYNKSAGETGKRWNVKQESVITIKPIKPSVLTPSAAPVPSAPPIPKAAKAEGVLLTAGQDHRTEGMESSSVLETPDASPTWQESVMEDNLKKGPFGRSYVHCAASCSPRPKQMPRGRSRKRSHRSPVSDTSDSDSHSSRSRSRSSSPSKKRYCGHHSKRSSSSSSRCSSMSQSPPRRRRHSYSSSLSGSWSRSRSRSASPELTAQQSRRFYRPSFMPGFGQNAKTNMGMAKKSKESAIEERRVVYVGRIRGTMTQQELRERFSLFGEIEDCTLHFRNHGDNYGFVTYYDTKDAFAAIENGSKLRKPDELPFDLCFGGRRQFCQTSYADLDSSTEYEPFPAKGKFHALDFDTLLKQAQQNLKR